MEIKFVGRFEGIDAVHKALKRAVGSQKVRPMKPEKENGEYTGNFYFWVEKPCLTGVLTVIKKFDAEIPF